LPEETLSELPLPDQLDLNFPKFSGPFLWNLTLKANPRLATPLNPVFVIHIDLIKGWAGSEIYGFGGAAILCRTAAKTT